METWRSQIYRAEAPADMDVGVLNNAIAVGSITTAVSERLPPIFTLAHLAHYTGARYATLRAIVSRRIDDPYRVFRIRKRSLEVARPRFRIICVPAPTLLSVQRWINESVLKNAMPHGASTAFAEGCSIRKAAERHCYSRWLIKLDVANFFESISELRVYRVFTGLGYQPLVSFELARLCTRQGSPTPRMRRVQWRVRQGNSVIGAYKTTRLGHLPQGAPTSPMLANLAMREFDARMTQLAAERGMEYSRYADDMTLSTNSHDFTRDLATKVIGDTFSLMGEFGFSPNKAKTRVSPPGSRKVVLGLLVDGPIPRLSRKFRHHLRQHLHYLLHPKIGPAQHAKNRGFAAIAAMRDHIWGLIAFALDIDAEFGHECANLFNRVTWPT